MDLFYPQSVTVKLTTFLAAAAAAALVAGTPARGTAQSESAVQWCEQHARQMDRVELRIMSHQEGVRRQRRLARPVQRRLPGRGARAAAAGAIAWEVGRAAYKAYGLGKRSERRWERCRELRHHSSAR